METKGKLAVEISLRGIGFTRLFTESSVKRVTGKWSKKPFTALSKFLARANYLETTLAVKVESQDCFVSVVIAQFEFVFPKFLGAQISAFRINKYSSC
ncbi:MAG: hypothetical protein ACXITV_02560 [Luteibaculaceae bacterium]